MKVYPFYKAIKTRLGNTASVFFFINQYAVGKQNTSYKVPAIYIETPKNLQLSFLGRKIQVAKNAEFKVHYISNAPFKNHDNTVQDSSIAAHETTVQAIEKLLAFWEAKDSNGKLLMQQLVPVGSSNVILMGDHVVTVLTFRTAEMYSYDLQ
jgi:hypothetical protein